MCEAGEREEKSCEILVQALKNNGRCDYHEELAKGLSKVVGKVDIVLAIQAMLFFLIVYHLGWK